MQSADAAQIGNTLYNDLEKVVLKEHPKVQALKDAFNRHNPLGCMMSGSGPTVFALTRSRAEAKDMLEKVQAEINDSDLKLWVAQFSSTGISILRQS